MTVWQIYWLVKLDDILNLIIALYVFFGLVSIVSGFISMASSPQDTRDSKHAYPIARRIFKVALPVFLVLVFARTLLPSTRQMVVIWLTPEILNNEQVKKLPNNIMELLNEQLEEWKRELTDKSKKK